MDMRALGKLLGPIKRRISLMVTRAVVSLVDSEQAMQLLQIKGLADELLDDCEHFEAYGFTSNPHPGAEGVALAAGGNRSHCIVVCVGDRRYRLKGLKSGEVAIYTDEGDSVHFQRGRKIKVTGGEEVSVATKRLTAEASASASVVSPEIVATCDTFDVAASVAANVDTPLLTVTGNLAVSGMVGAAGFGIGAPSAAEAGKVKAETVEDSAGSMAEMRQIYNGHTHTAPSGGGTTSAPAQGMS
ncbi:phage baseplate assembly protein V [Desulfocurvibacter africanus]|uniref:Phage baseplate assembly protein V n=1 Tax=Desulfocurvibacter africanus subsp. africanus str. Walvis Bay TaxID=690850 RepID=F3YW26_DESAF|nr:phage baseplate assembly protein V [Desulfocurvibacter africanus]EGJ49056.1 phage baseplate assembly protein V [Desulfocurvibacter africanus subsp. africanus str. Walvis Bay]